jgi:hypothetical protein
VAAARQVVTLDSKAFCRECADAVGWMLAARLEPDETDAEWSRILGRRPA